MTLMVKKNYDDNCDTFNDYSNDCVFLIMAAVHHGVNTLCCALAAGRLWEMFKCTINDCINWPRSLTLS